jgi:hypothetical protein
MTFAADHQRELSERDALSSTHPTSAAQSLVPESQQRLQKY